MGCYIGVGSLVNKRGVGMFPFKVFSRDGKPLCVCDVKDGGYPAETRENMRAAGLRIVDGKVKRPGKVIEAEGQMRLYE